ncbi:DUF4230 domain-containing protein [Maribellus maritimus]|uniref:DUF4230 domain-containing protein n=1 Tax=Maribellus maritimus TaxID=2870838 RepID=UPI001EEA7815|nr:DUF4230 domain-containing protein [Maribellus maritimus]MCG6186269.1 DUF4230 domain-containing protein [Maribellus maritimus]
METLILLGVILGLAAGAVISMYYYKYKNTQQLKEQSAVLLKQIKQVFKLVTVEGEFSEIFTHRNGKNIFFNLLQLEKKVILIVKARVMVGFDLTQIDIKVDSTNKKIRLSKFPHPQIISIDTDLEYYDIQKGIVNKLSEKDLTDISKKSKDFIREKVDESDLYLIAENQVKETIEFISQLANSVGWEMVTEKPLEKLPESNKMKD